jgi:ATP/maltotriose-dependent transcriptional regulator MalT/ActR/RegA family two-component response regulator
MKDNISVLLVDDHTMLRKGMALLLDEEADIEVIGEADDGEQAVAQARALQPDVVVMDINMPGMNGIEATRRIVSEFPDIKIIALSIHSGKRFIDDMLSAGAVGYVLKESAPEELLQGIRVVMRGNMYLSSAITSIVVGAYVDGMSAEEEDEPLQIDIGILQTKLYRPAAPLDLVIRTRLLERLTARRERPLTLISAPAGYGKSILISNWLESSDCPGAWLSLDECDSDLRQFVNYFVTAVQSVFAHACEKTRGLIGAQQLPSLRTLAGNLANELDAIGQPFILVLDDYHRIDAGSPVNELLQLLLEHPPIPLHLVILTRRDPPLELLSLRARNQITEIRMQDLCFTLPESRELLEKVADFTATDEALANLQQELEGWVVGLQLVSLTLRCTQDPNQLLNDLHGGLTQAREYLIQEVLAAQSPEIREWLLKTAILERLCASLCDAVCAGETGDDEPEFDGGKFVSEVFDSNLFIIPLDVQGEWLRYHHLFQHLLRLELERRMAPDEIAELHVRASKWFENRSLIEEAIQYAMEAGGGCRRSGDH